MDDRSDGATGVVRGLGVARTGRIESEGDQERPLKRGRNFWGGTGYLTSFRKIWKKLVVPQREGLESSDTVTIK